MTDRDQARLRIVLRFFLFALLALYVLAFFAFLAAGRGNEAFEELGKAGILALGWVMGRLS